jgi:primosomal protein N' (replication factor Y)
MALVAKVRFSSSLPQLDKEFDYLVPQDIVDTLSEGFQVQVPFGSGGKAKTGVVCSITEEATPRENLLTIQSVASITSVLSPQQLALCKAVAQRQAGTVGELLSTAIPKRYVRVEREFIVKPVMVPEHSTFLDQNILIGHLQAHPRIFFTPELLVTEKTNLGWAKHFALAAHNEYVSGRSTLVVLPDFAELTRFEYALEELGLTDISFRHSSADTGSQRHLNHLLASSTIGIGYGLRSACFSPAKNLGLILLWDDGDESHIEQSAPYWQSREVLLQRAELENSKVVLASNSPSTEVVRLLEIGHLEPLTNIGQVPNASVTELDDRLDAKSFALVSSSLEAGESVLIQIANAGWASSLICSFCKSLRVCNECSSSIWIDPSGKYRCRTCKASFELTPCTCGKTQTRPTRLGASAIAQQMERSFPSSTVIHSNGENRLTKVKGESLVVVATPGAEPQVEGGYAVVLMADASRMVGSPRLRALEQSVSKWANAISLAKASGSVVFVGLRESLANKMVSLDFLGAVKDDYQDRLELALPPQTRIASITSSNFEDHKRLVGEVAPFVSSGKVRLLSVEQANTVVLDYSYSFGIELADNLMELTQHLSRTSKSKKPGERVYRINMDDSKVI